MQRTALRAAADAERSPPNPPPMPHLDYSDPEAMFGLLLDWIADERADSQGDPERQRFLSEVLADLRTIEAEFPELPAAAVIQRLKDIHESVDPEFAGDPALLHLQHLIEELERVEAGAS